MKFAWPLRRFHQSRPLLRLSEPRPGPRRRPGGLKPLHSGERHSRRRGKRPLRPAEQGARGFDLRNRQFWHGLHSVNQYPQYHWEEASARTIMNGTRRRAGRGGPHRAPGRRGAGGHRSPGRATGERRSPERGGSQKFPGENESLGTGGLADSPSSSGPRRSGSQSSQGSQRN